MTFWGGDAGCNRDSLFFIYYFNFISEFRNGVQTEKM